ncbi:hypothetical protein, partial [Pantoea ananatis]
GLTDRPDAPSLAQPSSSRLPCRAVLAFVLSSARRMPPENPSPVRFSVFPKGWFCLLLTACNGILMKQKMNTNGADAFMTPEAIRKLVLTR